jgi:Bacterial surface proteins containing Ig-like domains
MKKLFSNRLSIAGYALVIAMFLSAISFISCKKSEEGGGSGSSSSVAVTSVSLNKTTLSMSVGGTEILTATVLPEKATNKTVTWESSNKAVATVSNGTVTAISEGSATITVKSADGKKSAKCEVTVKASSSVTEIKLNKTTLSLEVGAKETLTANTKVKWSSSAPLIASVTAEGVVTGVAVGKATITATSEDGKLTAKCEVEVKAVAVTEIKLNVAETITLAVGGTQTINCTVSPDNAANKNVKWTTSDNSKVEITSQSNTSATIKAVAVGSVTITATTEDGNHTAKCTVKVVAPADFEGEGTEADPYRISTLEHLKTLATKVNGGEKYGGKYFKLMNDIDLGGSSSPWTPIGSEGKIFCGRFDGNSKTISGLYINQPTLEYQALFGYVNYAEIRNLTVVGSVTGGRFCGGIVAKADGLTITGCTSNVTVTGENNYVGGIVGRVDGNYTIKNCTNKGKITGRTQISMSVGGIIGSACGASECLITDCSNSGNVAGYNRVGGIAGFAGYGSTNVFSCYNSGTISSDSESGYSIGGIVGDAGSGGSITDTYIVSCYNAGAVTAPKSGSIGGVVGNNQSGVVSSCYNTASVSGVRYVGGVVGTKYTSGNSII